MVGIKENLIKLSDYPFVYSVTGSLFVMIFQKNISPLNQSNNFFNELIPILIFIGIVGTIITIIDPLGRFIKLILKITHGIPIIEYFGTSKEVHKRSFYKRAVDNNWINYEIDKLVSAFYFIVILILLLIILSNPDYYKVYIDFVSLNLNSTDSTNLQQTSSSAISTSSNVQDSEQAKNDNELYSKIRETVFILFGFSLIGIIGIFVYSSITLNFKILIVYDYFHIIDCTNKVEFSDLIRSEITNLDKNFLDSINAHDWALAREFLVRIDMVSNRETSDKSFLPINSKKESDEQE